MTDRSTVERVSRAILGSPAPNLVAHTQAVAIAAELWRHPHTCTYVELQVEEAARRVTGEEPATTYDRNTAIDIVTDASARWMGCPEALLAELTQTAPTH